MITIKDSESYKAEIFRENGKFIAEISLPEHRLNLKMSGVGISIQEAVEDALSQLEMLLKRVYE